MYRPSTQFAERSNARANPKRAHCQDHPTGYVGTDQWGNYYKTCYRGKEEGLRECNLYFPTEAEVEEYQNEKGGDK